jgi:hypothetical protein
MKVGTRKTIAPFRDAGAGPKGVAIAAPAHRLPDTLRTGIESLSGLAMDDVRVHYNSSRPAALRAFAYTEGTEIHLGPGQERHLPHEAWHVVQQKQARVAPTFRMKGARIGADARLEKEADAMGTKALQAKARAGEHPGVQRSPCVGAPVVQMKSQIVKLEDLSPEMLEALDLENPDHVALLEADAVVDANAERLATSTGADVQELSPANQRFPADYIRDVTKLYIVGHGSGTTVGGMEPRRLAGNLYPAIFEEVKAANPQAEHRVIYEKLSEQVKMQSIDIVSCHSAEAGESGSTFAKEFYGFVSRLNQGWSRPLSVSGVDGYATVDDEGNVRAIPKEKIADYRSRKKQLKTPQEKARLLDEVAPSGKGIKKYVYDPDTLKF